MDIYRESDVRKVKRNMQTGGTPYSDEGQIEDAKNMVNIAEIHQRLSDAANDPPVTSEMLNDEDYFNKRNDYSFEKEGNFGANVGFGNFNAGSGGSIQGGMPKFYDPTNSSARMGIPTWHEEMPEDEKRQLQQMARYWCKWYYRNHPIVPTCLNIYARYPFVGLDLHCPDPVIEREYKQIFFDELNYEDFLPKAALFYWMLGEAAILGEWDEGYGSWVSEELMNPDHIEVLDFPGPNTKEEAFFWQPPESFIEKIMSYEPDDPRYERMVDNFGEDQIEKWLQGFPSELPPDVFSLLRHDPDINGTRGYPILMRGFHPLMKEEKYNQAMMSVAERLYTPFIIVKLGGKILQGDRQWMPSQEQLKRMQAHMEYIMTSNHRVMVYHSGIEIENPFSDQTIPNLNEDFDRVTKEIMGVFGISPELIYGGSEGTYASGALSAEIMMQNLAASQKIWSRWWIQERARKIAEAQGFYEVERKGSVITKPTERVRIWNPRTETYDVEERRIPMVPAIRMETMDWRDQEQTVKGLMNIKSQFKAPIPNQIFLSYYDSNQNLDVLRDAWEEEVQADYESKQRLGDAVPQDMQTQGPEMGGMGGDLGGMGGPPSGGPPGGRPSPGGPPSGEPSGENPNEELPGAGDRPPMSDGQREDQPTRTTSLKMASHGESTHVSDDDERRFHERLSQLDDEERERLNSSNAYFKRAESDPSYAEEHMFNTMRSSGRKTGTLYYMHKNRLQSRRVD